MIRVATRTTQGLLDLIVLSLAFWLAYMLRFEFEISQQFYKRLFFAWPYVVLFEYALLLMTGVTRYSWRYVGLREVSGVFAVMATAAAAFATVRITSASLTGLFPHGVYALIPFGVIAINFMLAFLGVTGVRVLRRMVGEAFEATYRRRGTEREPGVPTLLIGAGQAGVLVAKELRSWPGLNLLPVGFVDDDPLKIGTVIHGVPVLGASAELAAICEATGAKQAIITIANAPGRDIRRLSELCKDAGITPKIIPGIYEILDGRVNLSRIREVSVEDLLRRPAVELDTELLEASLTGKRVVVTGAGGSIGSELCRQVARYAPASLALIERSEFHLFSIHRELQNDFPDVELVPLMCDVCDEDRVASIFDEMRPEVVFHAAAHKHVPMMEHNPGEAIKNNVFGTRCVANAADRVGADRFVLVSTDKAVNPTSIMGATKRVAELYIQALSGVSRTKYVAVRFGNVLGSAGSVIPIFKDQIALGGPVTVTHPEMRRYFMTIPEASQLVMQAGAMGEGGEIFVLDMGEEVKIVDLATDLIRLSGLTPNVDIPIVFSGARPGEKLFEELGFDAEKMDKTRHSKIFVGRLRAPELGALSADLELLAEHCNVGHRDAVREALARVVPEMQDDINAGNTAVSAEKKPASTRRSRISVVQPALASSS